MKQIIKIGTRKSQLAMAQTEMVANAIRQVHKELEIQLVPMTTVGDRILDRPLDSFGGKGAFISEFEDAMLTGRIDLAVHSAKDMPISLPAGLGILAVSEREDPRDVLITRKDSPLKQGGIVGTSSLRRRLQLEELYEVKTENLRGNVGTRLSKLNNGEYDGIILAVAGLKRLNLLTDENFEYEYLSEETFIPAAGQGIIAVEGRQEEFLIKLLNTWHNITSMYCLETEREVLRLLNAGCSEPIGVYSGINNNEITLKIIYKYGDKAIRVMGTAAVEHRTSLAQDLVQKIRSSYE